MVSKTPSQRHLRLDQHSQASDLDDRNPVVEFLGEIDLLQYAEPLLANGFDDMETLMEVEDSDLAELGMPRGHVIRLRKRLRTLVDNHQQPSSCPPAAAIASPRVPYSARAQDAGHRGMQPTAQMTSSVQQSWEVVRSLGSDYVGAFLYKNLFELAPETKSFFPREVRARYQHWTVDEAAGDGDLSNSPALAALFGKVISAVGMSIAGLHETDSLVPRLKQLGMRHVNYGGITEAHFPVLQKALIRTLRQVLAESFTPEVEFAWTMVYSFITAIMIQGLREAQEMVGKCQKQIAPAQPPAAQVNASVHEITNGKLLMGGIEPYRIERHLQKAIYGDVYEAVGQATGRRYALKALDKDLVAGFQRLKQQQDHQFCESPMGEIQFKEMMRGLDHVMQLEDNFSDDSYHYVISQLASGGDLLDALRLRPSGFPEEQARRLVLGCAKGLASLHLRGLAMQDVSVENMLLHVEEDGAWNVKVCDPGQAATFIVDPCTGEESPILFKGFVGKDFRPPELYTQEPYLATKVDSWCLGWSAFYLLVAQPMFHTAEHAAQDPDWLLFESGQISELFQAKGWSDTLSPEAQDFILSLMALVPGQRISVLDALKHPWLAEASSSLAPEKADCSSSASATTGVESPSDLPSSSVSRNWSDNTSSPSLCWEEVPIIGTPQPRLLGSVRAAKDGLLKTMNAKESSWALR